MILHCALRSSCDSIWRAFFITIVLLITSINLSIAVMEQLSPGKQNNKCLHINSCNASLRKDISIKNSFQFSLYFFCIIVTMFTNNFWTLNNVEKIYDSNYLWVQKNVFNVMRWMLHLFFFFLVYTVSILLSITIDGTTHLFDKLSIEKSV